MYLADFNLILFFQIKITSRVFKLEFRSTTQIKYFSKLFRMVIDFIALSQKQHLVMVNISNVRIQADGCHSMIFFLLSLPGNDNSSAKFWIYLLQRRDRKEDADLSSLTGKTILHDYYQMDFLRIMFVIMFKLPVHLYLLNLMIIVA